MTEGKRGHGGARKGAGRPRKFDCAYKWKVGKRCEALFEEVKNNILAENLRFLTEEASELKRYWDAAKKVDPKDRKVWRQSEEAQAYFEAVAIERAALLAEYEPPPKSLDGGLYPPTGGALISLPNKPPKGTRAKIIKQVAAEFSIETQQVDKMWQWVRKLERETDSSVGKED